QRALGCFKLKPLVLQFLDSRDDGFKLSNAAGEVDTHLGGLVKNVALAREIRNQHPASVAGQLRVNVLVGGWVLHNRADVNAAFVRECALPDERQVIAVRDIRKLSDKTGRVG